MHTELRAPVLLSPDVNAPSGLPQDKITANVGVTLGVEIESWSTSIQYLCPLVSGESLRLLWQSKRSSLELHMESTSNQLAFAHVRQYRGTPLQLSDADAVSVSKTSVSRPMQSKPQVFTHFSCARQSAWIRINSNIKPESMNATFHSQPSLSNEKQQT
eukprot:6476610-Amphidinium_carterae.2